MCRDSIWSLWIINLWKHFAFYYVVLQLYASLKQDRDLGRKFLEVVSTREGVEKLGGMSETSAEGTTHSVLVEEQVAFANWINVSVHTVPLQWFLSFRLSPVPCGGPTAIIRNIAGLENNNGTHRGHIPDHGPGGGWVTVTHWLYCSAVVSHPAIFRRRSLVCRSDEIVLFVQPGGLAYCYRVGLEHYNVVTLRRARLIFGWVKSLGISSWYNQPPMSTQPFILSGSIKAWESGGR